MVLLSNGQKGRDNIMTRVVVYLVATLLQEKFSDGQKGKLFLPVISLSNHSRIKIDHCHVDRFTYFERTEISSLNYSYFYFPILFSCLQEKVHADLYYKCPY